MRAARVVAKRFAERILCAVGAPRLGAQLRRGRTLVLAYHNILPAGEAPCGDQSLHLPRQAFADQVEDLLETHDVVRIDAVWQGFAGSTRPRAVITFDDAYRGAVLEGVDVLVRLGVPGTIFAAPGRLDGRAFWWDEFADADSGEIDPRLRRYALEALAGRHDHVHAWAVREGRRANVMPAFATTATEHELIAAAARPGITVGAHSWDHPNLSGLDGQELRDELERPLLWLRERFAAALPVLAYPYGLSTTAVRRAAAAAGYRSAFRIDGGWMPTRRSPTDEPSALPRLGVPSGLSRQGFRLRACGVLTA